MGTFRRAIGIGLVLAAFLLLLLAGAQAQSDTAFTYQGRLEREGQGVTDTCAFRFALHAAPTGGDPLAGPTVVEPVAVTDGIFTAVLDFGDVFTQMPLYLQSEVRCGGEESFFLLAPRQLLTAVPYATRSGGVVWTDVSGVPADLADGDDDTTYSAGGGLTLSGTTFGVDYGAVARQNHDHLGQTWSGVDNSLVLTGSYDTGGFYELGEEPVGAALVLGNAHGNGLGLRVISAGRDGVFVDSAGGYGVYVGEAGHDGLRVRSADGAGVSVRSAPIGVHVDSAGTGVSVRSAGGDGMLVSSAGRDGVHVSSADDAGVYVHQAGNYGVHVNSAGGTGIYVKEADIHGVHVNSAGGNGVQVGFTGYDGVNVNFAGNNGVYVHEAVGSGVFVYTAGTYAGNFGGNVKVTGNLSKGGGSFVIDHPLDPENQYLAHSFVESPDMMNIYNGNVVLDANGEAWVELPAYFEALNRDFRYQLTPIGAPGPNLYIADTIQQNRFRIAGGTAGLEVSWQVTGIRQDAYANANRIVVEQEKPAEERGTYLHPVEHGQSESRGLMYKEKMEHEAEQAAREHEAEQAAREHEAEQAAREHEAEQAAEGGP